MGESASDAEVLIAEDGMHLTFQSLRLGRSSIRQNQPRNPPP